MPINTDPKAIQITGITCKTDSVILPGDPLRTAGFHMRVPLTGIPCRMPKYISIPFANRNQAEREEMRDGFLDGSPENRGPAA